MTGFAGDFPAATAAQWRALAGLQQAACDEGGGLQVQPLYAKAQNPPALLLPDGARRWRVMQRADHPDPVAANAQALTDLANGADGLVLVGADAPHGFGMELTGPILRVVLRDVPVGATALRLDAGAAAGPAALALADFAQSAGIAMAEADFDFGLDPLAGLAGGGGPADLAMLDTAAALAPHLWKSRTMIADGRPYHEAGASPAAELASVVATGLFYLRELERRGLELERARRTLSFLLAADAEIFLTLAKFRALRFLWARIEDACGLTPSPIRLQAETGRRMLSDEAAHGNIVRGALAAFAAGLGGADSVTVLPHTLAQELPDAAARRLAANTQTILHAEAHLSSVADPAAGAGAFESLTQEMCRLAWEKFQAIERQGGMLAFLAAGSRP